MPRIDTRCYKRSKRERTMDTTKNTANGITKSSVNIFNNIAYKASRLGLSLGILGALCLGTSNQVSAADGDPNSDYLQWRDELHDMVERRDMDTYELDFRPDPIERIIITDRDGSERVYHYMTFRLRNTISDDTKQKLAFRSRYAEVLQQIADNYEAEVDGSRLSVGEQEILNRDELTDRTRTIYLSVAAYDENDTRLDLLDNIYDGKMNTFNFDDEGKRAVEVGLDRVRKAIEEEQHRRLHLPSEIAGIELPTFDPATIDDEGIPAGQLNGVVIFHRLTAHGDRFTIKVRGLSNKMRRRVLVNRKDQKREEVENFYKARVYRRIYNIECERRGDEFYRDMDTFVITEHSWDWDNTFQRLERRRASAYARYFLDNIATKENKPNKSVEENFLNQHKEFREQNSDNLSPVFPPEDLGLTDISD